MTPWNQGCGVGVEESESEEFLTGGVGVGVVDNFIDSDSDPGQTFCSSIVTVCSRNVRKRNTWQFEQLGTSTRDDHVYSDRRQRTDLHTFTQGPFQISSVPWAHHATCTLWMQPFGACIAEISICSFWLALSLLRDVGYAPMNESSHGSSSILRNARHRTMITPVNPSCHRLIHISPSYQTVYRSFGIILKWVLSIGLEFKSNVLCKPIASKKHSIWY